VPLTRAEGSGPVWRGIPPALVHHLRERGGPELAKQVRHVSQETDIEGYDILSFDQNGTVRYIEVKATSAANLSRGFYVKS